MFVVIVLIYVFMPFLSYIFFLIFTNVFVLLFNVFTNVFVLLLGDSRITGKYKKELDSELVEKFARHRYHMGNYMVKLQMVPTGSRDETDTLLCWVSANIVNCVCLLRSLKKTHTFSIHLGIEEISTNPVCPPRHGRGNAPCRRMDSFTSQASHASHH